MNDEQIGNVNPSNGTGDDQSNNALLTAEQKIVALEEQNKKLYARTKTAEGFIQDADGNWVKKEKPVVQAPTEINKPDSSIDDKLWTVAEMIREGYTRQDVDFIMRNGGKEALNDPKSIVSVAMKTVMEQRNAELQAAKATDTSGLTDAERKYTPEQLKKMSRAELEKLLPHA